MNFKEKRINTKSEELSIDEIDFKTLAKNCKNKEDLSKLTKQFMKQMIEGMLEAELEEHICKNTRTVKNGTYPKRVRSDAGELELNILTWRGKWVNLIHYFKYSKEIRRIIYTTNIIESDHRKFRMLTKTKGAFPYGEQPAEALVCRYSKC